MFLAEAESAQDANFFATFGQVGEHGCGNHQAGNQKHDAAN